MDTRSVLLPRTVSHGGKLVNKASIRVVNGTDQRNVATADRRNRVRTANQTHFRVLYPPPRLGTNLPYAHLPRKIAKTSSSVANLLFAP
jgi:hypothetical protein